MKLCKTLFASILALVMILSPLAGTITAEAATNGKLNLSYRYGTSNLIQMNTNLPSDTPLANFTTGDNGCSIDQSGNTVQWVGWIQMDNVDGTIVLTFHFNNAFTAGQSYVLPKGAIFGFTDGKSYALDGDYTFTFDGASWSMGVENNVDTMDLAYRWGNSNTIQMNTTLPASTPLANFTVGQNGCSIDQSGNTVQWVGWIGMDNVGGTIVLTFHFNNAFTAGQSYFLPAGSVFGFTDGYKYVLDRDYTFTFDGSAWSIEKLDIGLSYRYGTNTLIQYNTNLPVSTPIADFLADANGCVIGQSGNQQVGWIQMNNADGTIVLTFHFNRAFSVGESYTISADSLFGFTDGEVYQQKSDITLYWDGANWTTEKPYIELAYRWGTNTLIQYNTNLPVSTPIADFLADANGCVIGQSGNQQVGWIQMHEGDPIILTFHFNNPFAVGESYTLSAGSVFGFTDGARYELQSDLTLYWDGANWTAEAPHVHSYESVVTAPTATKEGYTTHTCSGCGDSYTDSIVPAIGIGELAISGASLSLHSDLSINIYVDANLFIEDAYTAPYIVCEFGYKTMTITDYKIVDGKYVFTCDGISPSQIGDAVNVTLNATLNGEQYQIGYEYGVAAYCYSMLAKTDDSKLKTLLVDLLNYGAAAQEYASYKNSTLCNADLTEEQRSWGTQTVPAVSSVLNTKYATVENAKAKWKGASLYLENNVSIRARFAAESIEGLSVKATIGDNTYVITEFVADEANPGSYFVYFDQINASQMRETVYLTVCEGDTAVSNTVTYSVESYVAAKLNDSNVKLANLVASIIKYGDAAYNLNH